jgi:cytochrome c556
MKKPFNLLTVVMAVGLCTSIFAQTAAPTIDEEITRLRKELIKAQVDCQRVIEEIAKDKKDFDAYHARTLQRMTQARSQIDSLKQDITRNSSENDGLAAQISNIQAKFREIELSQDDFRLRLVGVCKRIEPAASKLPPITMVSTMSTLSLLANDLNTRAIDNIEGCTRLVQIINRMEDNCSSIQIAQESSPVSDIRGMVYRLRIGTFFEAVVDLQGQKCALFEGLNNDGSPRWKTQDSPQTAQAILQAVNIREGKSLPAFVNLPLASEVVQGGGL